MNEQYAAGQTLAEYADGPIKARALATTLRQSLDAQIVQAEKRVADLKATKERMESSGILDQRIGDLQTAMRF